MSRELRPNAGNRYAEVLRALKGDYGDSDLNTFILCGRQPEHANDSEDLNEGENSVGYPTSMHKSCTNRVRPKSSKSKVISDTPSRPKTAQDTLEAEILSLRAECNNLELQLTKAKLDKRQADLTSALAVELQPIRSGPTFVQQDTVTGILTNQKNALYKIQYKCNKHCRQFVLKLC